MDVVALANGGNSVLSISDKQLNIQAPRRNLLRFTQAASEFEVQSFLFEELKRLGYAVRGEVVTYARKARFDIAIYNQHGERFPVRIVEVKRRRRSAMSGSSSGRQVHRYYDDFGVPVDLVGGLKEARRYLELIRAIIPLPAFNRETA